MPDLVGMIRQHLDPDVLAMLGNVAGVSSAKVARATDIAVPTIVAAMARSASTDVGARALLDAVRTDRDGAPDPASFRALLARDDGQTALLHAGTRVDERIFGARLASLTRSFADQLEISAESAHRIFVLLTTLVMGVIARHVEDTRLSRDGLASTLRGLPPASGPDTRTRDRGWLWAILAAFAIVSFGGFFLCKETIPSTRTRPIGGGPPPVSSEMDDFADYLHDTNAPVPRTFRFEQLRAGDDGKLSAEARAFLGRLSEVLMEHPDTSIRIDGFGIDGLARAGAVKQDLVRLGATPGRITVAVPSEQGDPRVEIVVTTK